MFKKIGVFICIFVVVLLSFLAVAQHYRIADLERSVDGYRSDLEFARRSNERYADIFREAREANRGIGECLSEHVSTLSQLREQLQAVRGRYEEMQAILADMESGWDNCDGDNDSNDNRSSSGSESCTLK